MSEAMTNMSEGINDSVANITDCTTSVAEIDTQIEGVTKEVDEMKSVSSDVQEQSESGQKLVNHVLEHLNMLHDKMTNSKQAQKNYNLIPRRLKVSSRLLRTFQRKRICLH
nr:hypothetical protein [Bacillus pumilus]